MKSTLNTDELAAIFTLKNLTSTINKADMETKKLLTIQSSPNNIISSDDDEDVDEDDDNDDNIEGDEDGDDIDGDDDDDGDDFDNHDENESDGNYFSDINPNSNIKNVKTKIEETVGKIRIFCPDAILSVLDSQLDEIIRSVCLRSLKSAPSLLRNIFSDPPVHPHLNKILAESTDKQFLNKIEILLKATVVYFHSLQKLVIDDEMDTVDELLQEYSPHLLFLECRDDPAEAQYLLNFRNFMKKALCIIPAKRNKMLLINICALLEGSRRIYITGGTQSTATTRRTIIYEHESGQKRKCRPDRRRKIPKVVKKPVVSKEMVTCSCGAYILKRTMWKHSRSKRHSNPIPLPPPSLPLPLPSTLPDNKSVKSEPPQQQQQSSSKQLSTSASSAPQFLLNERPVHAYPSAAPAAKRQRQSKPRHSMLPPPGYFQNPPPVVPIPTYYSQPQPFQQHFPQMQMQMPPMFPMFSPLMHDMSAFMQPHMDQAQQQQQFVVQQPGYGGGYFIPVQLPPSAMTAGSTGPQMVGFVRIDTGYVYPTQHPETFAAHWK